MHGDAPLAAVASSVLEEDLISVEEDLVEDEIPMEPDPEDLAVGQTDPMVRTVEPNQVVAVVVELVVVVGLVAVVVLVEVVVLVVLD